MRNKILFPLLLLINLSAFCQLNFENISFDAALQKAKQTGQIIFLQFEAETCDQCNQVADKAFENKKLADRLELGFVCVKITTDHPDRQQIAGIYNKKAGGFGSLFISSDGTFLHNYPATSTNPDTYETEIDKALLKAGEGIKLSDLERQYNGGNRSLGLMELLIQTKNKLRLEIDSLLNEYVSLLPEDSIMSKRILVFIVTMIPLLDSKPDLYLHKTYEAINKKKYPDLLPMHTSFNSRIANKSLQKAIIEKNENYALRVAQFARSIYPNNLEKGLQSYESKMMEYYQKTDNISSYLKTAIEYYDKYYMNISVDSIKTQDSFNRKKIFKEKTNFTTEKRGDTILRKYRSTFKYSPIANTYTRELNNAAYSFYELTDQPLYLAKALQWSERANEFAESFSAMDTHAQLLYRLSRKKEAIEWLKKAIALKTKQGLATKDLEKRLAAMK